MKPAGNYNEKGKQKVKTSIWRKWEEKQKGTVTLRPASGAGPSSMPALGTASPARS